MKKQTTVILLTIILCMTFWGCDGMATLFHGEKPKAPPVTYTVTFDANKATSGTPPEMQTVNAGTVINLHNNGGLSKSGYIFVGWDESSSGSDTTYSIGASVTVTRNMVFYARWFNSSTPKYWVAFDANGAGGTPPASQEVYKNISITLPGKGTLSLSGKVFGGWNILSNGGGTNYLAGATYKVTEDVILFAKWQSEVQYTVTYFANGASGTPPEKQTVDPGTPITIPDQGSLTNLGKTFEGWNTQANGSGTSYVAGTEYTVMGNTSLYAQWLSVPIEPPGATFEQKLQYIRNNAGNGVVYDIVVDRNETVGPQTVSTLGRNITVIIRSANPASVYSITLGSSGHLFSVEPNVTLKLQDIVLRGRSNTRALILVEKGGKLILNSGSKVTSNTNSTTSVGSGIRVDGGILEMYDGCEISENVNNNYSGGSGGGIAVTNQGTVFIFGGTITGNRTTGYSGGGILLSDNSTVTMTGGVISKNRSQLSGGGVSVNSGSIFKKHPAAGSEESGIIYGSIGENANIISDGYPYGNAISRSGPSGSSLNYRNTTLGYYDVISTLSDEGWGE